MIYTHIHTHTYTSREREREREKSQTEIDSSKIFPPILVCEEKVTTPTQWGRNEKEVL